MSIAAVRTAVGLLAVAAAGAASAESTCAKLWFRVAAQGAKGKASCHAKAAASGLPVDGTCLAAAEQRLATKWTKAALKGDCPTNADAADAQQVVDAFIANLVDLLTPPTVSHCCQTATADCFAGPLITESSCLELLGTLGPPGSICEGATGTCVAPPGTGGSCCALPQFSVCTAGPTVSPAGCVTAGGFDVPFAVCLENGACAFP